MRQIRRASKWTTSLIIFIMVVTFLNLVVVSGILVGLIQGAVDDARTEYTSDVIVSTLNDKNYIENSPNIISLVETFPEVERWSARYRETGIVEANYKTRKETDKPNTVAAQLVGIDPFKEEKLTGLSSHIIKGSYIAPGDYDQVILGHYLLKQYFPIESAALTTLENVDVGTKIRMTIGDVTREVVVKGVFKSKVDEINRNVYMVDSQFRNLIGRSDGNVDEIALKLREEADPVIVREALIRNGVAGYAKVQTYVDAQPQFLKDIITTFNMLGAAFSSLGLIVASITIFIVVFINAITRRRFIGILKGIGINKRAVELSYVIQSIFYAVLGSAIGLLIVYGFLVPYFKNSPIDFPFSDGILVAPVGQTFVRVGLLVLSTVIAGYIPAWMIIRRNTLDSILGRN